MSLKEVNYIKDSEGNLGIVKEKPVIFGRAIPRNAEQGSRYWYGKGSKLKVKYYDDLTYDSSVWYTGDGGGMLTYTGNNSYLYGNMIVTIPADFDFEKFISDSEYCLSCIKTCCNYNGNTMSPYFVIKEGKVICVKPTNIKPYNLIEGAHSKPGLYMGEESYLISFKRKINSIFRVHSRIVKHVKRIIKRGELQTLDYDTNPTFLRNCREIIVTPIAHHGRGNVNKRSIYSNIILKLPSKGKSGVNRCKNKYIKIF